MSNDRVGRYTVKIDGDATDADCIGVCKTITATGAEYIITGPLAKALEALYERCERRFEQINEAQAQQLGDAYEEIAALKRRLADQDTQAQGQVSALASAPEDGRE
jgi:hypothetical protein